MWFAVGTCQRWQVHGFHKLANMPEHSLASVRKGSVIDLSILGA
jgi:hypothetical protein